MARNGIPDSDKPLVRLCPATPFLSQTYSAGCSVKLYSLNCADVSLELQQAKSRFTQTKTAPAAIKIPNKLTALVENAACRGHCAPDARPRCMLYAKFVQYYTEC